MTSAWRHVTSEADPWLDSLTTKDLLAQLPKPGNSPTVGDAIRRVT
jgi:hypothetical protein